MSPNSFHSGIPQSKPPTNDYDRDSFVLLLSSSPNVLKYLKMHLNRFFSHVVAVKKISECTVALKERNFDILITDYIPDSKTTVDQTKKIGMTWRSLPVIIVTEAEDIGESYKYSVIAGVVGEDMDLDSMHSAIRKAIDVRKHLIELDSLLPSRVAIGKLIHSEDEPEGDFNKYIKAVRDIINDPEYGL